MLLYSGATTVSYFMGLVDGLAIQAEVFIWLYKPVNSYTHSVHFLLLLASRQIRLNTISIDATSANETETNLDLNLSLEDEVNFTLWTRLEANSLSKRLVNR